MEKKAEDRGDERREREREREREGGSGTREWNLCVCILTRKREPPSETADMFAQRRFTQSPAHTDTHTHTHIEFSIELGDRGLN